jgi:VanZ family protein
MGFSRWHVLAFRVALAATLVFVMFMATTKTDFPVIDRINDKVDHATAFFVLALLADFSRPRERYSIGLAASLLGFGLLIEVVQYFIPYRTFSLFDLTADAVGLALYALALPMVKHMPVLKRRWDAAPTVAFAHGDAK